MRFSPPGNPPRLVDLDFTAMVDLVFLLIIFFLTTSTFIERNKTLLPLPEDSTAPRPTARERDESALIVNITRNGTIIVSSEYVMITELRAQLLRDIASQGGDPSKLKVILRADRDAPLKFINEVARTLTDLGVKRWTFATELVSARRAEEGAR